MLKVMYKGGDVRHKILDNIHHHTKHEPTPSKVLEIITRDSQKVRGQFV